MYVCVHVYAGAHVYVCTCSCSDDSLEYCSLRDMYLFSETVFHWFGTDQVG